MDSFLGSVFGSEGHLVVVGEKNKETKKYTVYCKTCALDSELNGSAYYTIAKDKLLLGQIPCGCSKRANWNRNQYEIILKRALIDGFYFVDWAGDYVGNRSKITISCPRHGVLPPKTISDVLSGRRCIECRRDNVKKSLTKTDGEWIEEFIMTGAYKDGTIFVKSDKKIQREGYRDGVGGFWNVTCPVCNEISTQHSADLRHGKLGCACSHYSQKYAYIHTITDGDIVLGLKFGISNSKFKRLARQRLKSKYHIDCFGVWEFNSVISCKLAERDVKLNIPIKLFNKEEMADGFTETCHFNYLEDIMRIYEVNGGRRVVW